MGDYRHRLYSESERVLALAEYESVLAIEPAHGAALTGRDHILNGITPVLLPRDLDVVADYELHDKRYNDNRNAVADLFNAARDMLQAAGE